MANHKFRYLGFEQWALSQKESDSPGLFFELSLIAGNNLLDQLVVQFGNCVCTDAGSCMDSGNVLFLHHMDMGVRRKKQVKVPTQQQLLNHAI